MNNKKPLPSKIGIVFRIVMGIYLMYMGVKVLTPQINAVDKDWFLLIAGALFLILGIAAFGFYAVEVAKGRYEGGLADLREKEALEEASEKKRITFSDEEEKERNN